MFGKNNNPQRKPFELNSDQIIKDIEAISLDEEQRNKLYLCLDDKPPHEHQFSKVEDFLKGTENLDDTKQKLEGLVFEVDQLLADVSGKMDSIYKNVEKYKSNG